VVALAAPGGNAVAQQAPNDSILFTQSHYDSTGAADATALYRVKPSGDHATPMTPLTVGNFYVGGHWSLSGRTVIYEHYTGGNILTRSQIYRIDRQGGSIQRITSGPSRHQRPVWGPGPWIAYIDGGIDFNQCLTLVRPTGTENHVLFCAPRSDAELSDPRWSTDGKKIYVEAYYYGQHGLEPPSHSDVYEVNITTGLVTLVHARTAYESSEILALSPDATHAIYGDDGGGLHLVDFATDSETIVPGSSPVYSKDGTHIAFTRYLPAGGVKQFGAIFIMRADGSNPHRVIDKVVGDDAYRAATWSNDGSHILLNRTRYYVQDGQGYDHLSMHMLDVKAHAVTKVADGTAVAWLQL